MSALAELNQAVTAAVKANISRHHKVRGTKLVLQVSGVGKYGRAHLLWAPLVPGFTKRDIVTLDTDVRAVFASHEDFEYQLHVTRTDCASFGDTVVDITNLIARITA